MKRLDASFYLATVCIFSAFTNILVEFFSRVCRPLVTESTQNVCVEFAFVRPADYTLIPSSSYH